MSSGFTCGCTSPDCMVNGCALYRRYQEFYRGPGYYQAPQQVGWTCPNCGSGVAPGVESCPHCRPAPQVTWTSTTGTGIQIETPILEGENHERSSHYQQTKEAEKEET